MSFQLVSIKNTYQQHTINITQTGGKVNRGNFSNVND
jgi:hypothetical protein